MNLVDRKILISIVLIGFILVGTLYPTIIASITEYDPWLDPNDDGMIRVEDVLAVALAFGSDGEPVNKTALLLELQTARAHDETYSTALAAISGYPAILNWQDMADMIVEITLETEGTLLIMFSTQARIAGTGQEMYVRAMVDSTLANPSTGVTLTKSAEWSAHSYTFYSSNAAAGAHTIKIQWKLYDELGSGEVSGRTLTVIALPT